ncbi:hypothetical protein K439DRAFT_1416197 [Ramaria rubella]|nr:hypothetical protein K439DRAFT_1416197 [Ramaria rubella]
MLNPVRLPHRVRSVISSSFHHFGIHCASHPKRVILISCVVITSLFYPALSPYSSSNPTDALSAFYSFFDPYQSDLHEIWDGLDALHVLEDSATKTRCGLERTLRIERVLVPSYESTLTGAATPVTLQFASQLGDRIRSALNVTDATLSCVRTPNGECFVLSPDLFFKGSIPSSPADVLQLINTSPNISISEIPLETSMVFLSRSSADDRLDKLVEHVGSLAFTYFFLERDCLSLEGHGKWMQTLTAVASDSQEPISLAPFVFQKPRFLALQYDPTLSRPSHFSAISLFLYLSYLGVFLSFSGSLRRMDTVHSRFGLTFTALVEIVASTITSVSVCALAGFPITMVPWGILPVIIVFVGAENMFLLVDAVTSTSISLSVKQRVGTGLAMAGTSNTLNTVSYNTILGIIAFFATGAIRQFCSFAIVLLVAHWFLIHTFFIAVLSIDLQRLELSDMLTQDKALKPVLHPAALKPTDGPPVSKSRLTMSRIQERLRVVPAKNGSLVLMLAVTVTLYYVTYPFPSRPNGDADPLAFLQQAMRRPIPLADESPSPALNLWNILNPEHDPLVHIRVERPMIVAQNAQGTSERRGDGHGQDLRSYEHIAKRSLWLLKIVILPIGTTTSCLYFLLLYLLKDADLLEAQQNRPEGGSKDITSYAPSPVEGNVSFKTLPRAFATDVELITTNRDASVIAIVSTENELVVWDGEYHKLDVWDVLSPGSSNTGSQSCITCVALDHTGRYCAIGTGTGMMALWKVSSPGFPIYTNILSTSTPMTSITDLMFISSGVDRSGGRSASHTEDLCIVATCENGIAFQTHPNRGAAIHPITPSHSDIVLRLHLIRTLKDEGVYIAYTFRDGTVELLSRFKTDQDWDSICVLQAGNHADPIAELCVNFIDVDGTFIPVLGAVTRSGVVSLWDPVKSECIFVLDNSFGDIGRVRIAPIQSQPCQRCGELTPNAFTLAVSAGNFVFVHRFSVPSVMKRCTCPVTRTVYPREGFGRRSRSGSMASSASSSPPKPRLKLPSVSLSVSPMDVAAFPISGHGVHSRRAGSEKESIRRASESLLTITAQSEESETMSSWSPKRSSNATDSRWRNIAVDQITDISCERGGWDLVDGHRLIGLRRRSRLAQSANNGSPLSSAPPAQFGKGELTPAVLERWEFWTFDPGRLDAGVRVSSLLALTPAPSPSTKGSLYPRLPFTRVDPMTARPSACVAGFGNTVGIINLAK